MLRILDYDPSPTSASEVSLPYGRGRSSLGDGTSNARRIAKIVEEHVPDVVYLWNLHGLGAVGILQMLRQRGVPWVWHLMSMAPIPPPISGGSDQGQGLRVFADGTYIVCASHLELQIRDSGLDIGRNVHPVPNWVTNDGPRREGFFSDGVLRLMNTAEVFDDDRETEILIEAAAKLRERGYPKFTLDLYGHVDGKRFEDMLLYRGVADMVRFMGSCQPYELLARYSDYDLFVAPITPTVPLGFALLNAASFGCVPLICGDSAAAEWLVGDVHCLKAEREADAITQRIMDVMCGRVDLKALGRRTQAVVCTDFHLDTVSHRVETVLQQAASRVSPL